jgi:adenylate cyclase
MKSEATRPMRFRIGINVGDVMVKDGDIFGDGVNVAARLEGLAEGGGICVSRGVRDHLRHRTNFVFEDLGEQLVKNIAHPIRAYRLRIGEGADQAAAEASAPPDTELASNNEVALELALWESVKDGGPAELASYLEHYPQGTFASLARTRRNSGEDKAADNQAAKTAESEVTHGALDLAFWDAIKESQRPEELAAYLERHPEGHFAALARAHLSQPVEDDRQDTEQALAAGNPVELVFWESIRDTEDRRLLSAYLEKFPDGEFAVIAHARLDALRDG